jgi:DNA repair exonuclease SbcCD ATPase subunit
MLKRIILRNFQQYRHKIIDFADVTSIIGPNGAGKSTIVRALEWVCLNLGNTKEITRWGAKYVKVSLYIGDREIIRKAGPKTNIYLLDGKPYTDLRVPGRVPEDIARIINLGEENFQNQLDQPFWFLDTPGQVSKNLNAIVNLTLIDDALAWMVSETKKAKIIAEVAKNRLAEARKVRSELCDAKLLNERLLKIEKKQAKLEDMKRMYTLLRSTISQIDTLEQEVRHLQSTSLRDEKALSQRVVKLSTLTHDRDKLAGILTEMTSLGKELHQCEEHFKKLDRQRQTLTKGQLCPVCERPMP